MPWLNIQYGSLVLAGPKSELDDEIVFTGATSLEEILVRRDDVVWNVVERLFYSVNWPNFIESREASCVWRTDTTRGAELSHANR